MASYVIDSSLFKDWFGTKRSREIFSDEDLIQKWMDFEAALARAQGDMGLIPQEAAAEIARKANVKYLDLEKLKIEFDNCGHPLVPMIKAFKAACDGSAGQYVHYGTTTQDVMDTGMVLQMKELYEEIFPKLCLLRDNCKKIALENENVIMAGRTHGQHALPITMGFKAAVWVSELDREIQRMRECTKRVFVGQFSGAAGTLAGIEHGGLELVDRTMKLLGLETPVISWHAARDSFAEFITLLGLVTASVARIGNEVIILQKTEYSELEEPWKKGNIGSSTMPHKRNPLYSQRLVALSKMVRYNVPLALECMVGEHERDLRGLCAEWAFLGQTCIMADAVVAFGVHITTDMIIRPKNMERNLNDLNGLIMSEHLMFIVGKKVGRLTAHEIIYNICMDAYESGAPLLDKLMENDVIREGFTREEIAEALDPTKYTGLCSQYIHRVCDND